MLPYFCFTLDSFKTDIAQSGQRQIPFLKPHLVTVTDTRLTSGKYVVNVFLKDITIMQSGQDSNPRPSAPNTDASITRPQRNNLYLYKYENVCLSVCLYTFFSAISKPIGTKLLFAPVTVLKQKYFWYKDSFIR